MLLACTAQNLTCGMVPPWFGMGKQGRAWVMVLIWHVKKIKRQQSAWPGARY
jgi:hypothetical protein